MLEWREKELTYLVLFRLLGPVYIDLFGLGWPIWSLVDLSGSWSLVDLSGRWLTYLVLVWPIWSLVDLSGLGLTCLVLGPWLICLALA